MADETEWERLVREKKLSGWATELGKGKHNSEEYRDGYKEDGRGTYDTTPERTIRHSVDQPSPNKMNDHTVKKDRSTGEVTKESRTYERDSSGNWTDRETQNSDKRPPAEPNPPPREGTTYSGG